MKTTLLLHVITQKKGGGRVGVKTINIYFGGLKQIFLCGNVFTFPLNFAGRIPE